MKKLLSLITALKAAVITTLSTLFVTLFTSNTALAHTDHHLTGTSHEVYHVVFWSLFTIVVFKAVTWFNNRKKSDKKQ